MGKLKQAKLRRQRAWPDKARLIVAKGKRGWYWKLRAGNNRTIALGGEPFSSERSALRAFKTAREVITRFGFYGITRIGVRVQR